MIWFDTIARGLLLGGLYALFAAGLRLVFGIMRLVNLAHGDLIALAPYVILTIVSATDLNPFLAATLALPVMFGVGMLLQTHLFNRVLGDDILPPLVVTFGLSVVIQNGLLEVFSADRQKLSMGPVEAASVPLGPVTLGLIPLATLGSAIAVITALNLLFYRTKLGRAFRATSDDRTTVQLMGIYPHKVFAIATGIALMVTTLAALYPGGRANFDPSIGPARLLYAFEAVIIGGLGSLWGTLAGGLVIGVPQALGAAVHPEWQILAGHLAFVAVLMFKPRGLFPRAND